MTTTAYQSARDVRAQLHQMNVPDYHVESKPTGDGGRRFWAHLGNCMSRARVYEIADAFRGSNVTVMWKGCCV